MGRSGLDVLLLSFTSENDAKPQAAGNGESEWSGVEHLGFRRIEILWSNS
jgi:hypothetical protein